MNPFGLNEYVPLSMITVGRVVRRFRRSLPLPPRVYVASPEGLAAHAQGIGAALVAGGFEVCSRWHDLIGQEPRTQAAVVLRARLRQNLADLARADLMVVWTATGAPRTTYVECGWAQVLGVPTLWVQGLTGTRTLGDQGPGVEVLLDDSHAAILAGARALLGGAS